MSYLISSTYLAQIYFYLLLPIFNFVLFCLAWCLILSVFMLYNFGRLKQQIRRLSPVADTRILSTANLA